MINDIEEENFKSPISQLMDELGDNHKDVLLLIREMAEQIGFYRRLLERYELDVLTGLPGNNKFREIISNIESHVRSAGIIFFDVNGLKLCNDTGGHHAGDMLLQKAAESIMYITGGNVQAFRTGGDEFVALVTDCAESDIDEIIVKWSKKLNEMNNMDDGVHCSIAFGTAFGEGEYKISDLLELADARMYNEKRKMKSTGK